MSMMSIEWRPMAEFKKNSVEIPNRLVFLKIKNPENNALYDMEPDKSFITMGH
jgi:hypothetical protein